MALIELPGWARVSEWRRSHIQRVTVLLLEWAEALKLDAETMSMWREAGTLHDALRDAPEHELRALTPDLDLPASLLHGPAVANKLRAEGEDRAELLEAVRWHTVGNATWGGAGRALYMADFLEPGRTSAHPDRALLSTRVVHDFDGVFREVVRERTEWICREGHTLHPKTVELWNSIR